MTVKVFAGQARPLPKGQGAVIEVSFGVEAEGPLPEDHGYALFAALERAMMGTREEEGAAGLALQDGELHGAEWIQIAPLGGRSEGKALLPEVLRVRVRGSEILRVLPLAGRKMKVAGTTLRLATRAEANELKPLPNLVAKCVAWRDLDRFAGSASPREGGSVATMARLVAETLGIRCGVRVGRRRDFTIKGIPLHGYEVAFLGLEPRASLVLQTEGVGSWKRFGCGFLEEA